MPILITQAPSEATITSVKLVEQVNIFRNQEGERSELRHADLLRIIEDEFDEEIGERKISLTSYTDKSNRQSKCYELTEAQAIQVLVRESKFVRRAIIAKYRELKASANTMPTLPQTYKQALIELVGKIEENERLEAENKALAPKGEAFDELMDSSGNYSNTVAAKMLGTGLQRLCNMLRVMNLYNSQNIPYQRYIEQGLFEVKTTVKNGMNFSVSVVTPKGVEKIRELMKNRT